MRGHPLDPIQWGRSEDEPWAGGMRWGLNRTATTKSKTVYAYAHFIFKIYFTYAYECLTCIMYVCVAGGCRVPAEVPCGCMVKDVMALIDFRESYLAALELTTCLSFPICKAEMTEIAVPASQFAMSENLNSSCPWGSVLWLQGGKGHRRQ